MNQADKAKHFGALHEKGKPLVLYNAWDAGSAKAIVAAGAPAIATSSWAVAAAHGYTDGEALPLELVYSVASRIVASVDVPVTVDFEGGYSASSDDDLARNVGKLIELGAIGINFEDRLVHGKGMYGIADQARRIATIRKTAEKLGVGLFINARTDLFLSQGRVHVEAVGEAIERASAYAAAGASGLFVPGLADEALIARITETTKLPVNVMMMDGVPPVARLATLGVARVSYGATPYGEAMRTVQAEAEALYRPEH